MSVHKGKHKVGELPFRITILTSMNQFEEDIKNGMWVSDPLYSFVSLYYHEYYVRSGKNVRT